jgi:DNA-binding response OmpR family regulator
MYKPHVLIVDDEKDICDLIYEDLSGLGYLCEIALDGDCALQKIIEEEFDITLLDIRLPGISGIEVLKEIKTKSSSAIIMITAISDVNTAVESMKLGALDYIVKPFSLDVLNTSISIAFEKNSKSVIYSHRDIVDEAEEELKEIESIANGIELKLDLADKRSTIITSRTIKIAREIGIPEEQIKKWEAKRVKTDRKNLRVLKKFNQNALAQMEMGIAPKYLLNNNFDNSEN